MKNAYLDLLKCWCDRLMELQIREISDSRLNGGILCPVCHRLHGRSADILPSLMLLFRDTGKERASPHRQHPRRAIPPCGGAFYVSLRG